MNYSEQKTKPSFLEIVPTLIGAILLSVFVPTVLCWVRIQGLVRNGHMALWDDLQWLTVMVVVSGVICSPGAIVLSLIILPMLRKSDAIEKDDEAPVMRKGALIGCLLGFTNVPGYFANILLAPTPNSGLRLVSLFAVTGATCGAWLGWQAYRHRHGRKAWFPRFNLSTLIFLVMGWGVLLALFMPERHG